MLACFAHFLPVHFLRGTACLLLAVCFLGCNGGSRPETAEEETSSSNARQLLEKQRLCADNFAKIYQILSPTPDNVDTELQSVQDILNQWLTSCAEWTGQPVKTEAAVFQGLPEAAQLSSLNDRTASQLDILYLRDNLLMRGMLEQIIAEIPEDTEKVRAVFHYVVRNITNDEKLINPLLLQAQILDEQTVSSLGPRSIPRSLQDIALSGRGTAEDRAWLVASLLQQMGLDALLVAPAAAEGQKMELQLMLVPLEQEILIFSPAWGVEFRKAEGNWTAADLTESWEQVFSSLPLPAEAQGLVDPLKQANWKQVQAKLPYSPLLVSPRMQALQMEFVGDYVCEVYQPLMTAESDPESVGLMSEMQKSLGTVFENFAPVFWDYPLAMYSRLVAGEEQVERLRSLYLLSLLKDVQSLRSSEDQNEQKVITASLEKRMLMARIDQLLGQESDAISTYMKLRLQQGVAGQDQKIAFENLMRYIQAEDAHYWSALSQYENKDFRSSANTLQNYLNRYQQGHWVQASRELLAQAYLAQGEKAKASETLQQMSVSEQDRVRQVLLMEANK